jgi:hypothetical protein
MAYIWDMQKHTSNDQRCRGTLYQGYMMRKDYKWDFPLNDYCDTSNQYKREEETKSKIMEHAKKR